MVTSWNTVISEKLIVAELVNKLPAFYGTQNFFTVFIRTHLWSLS
jgi:hypothetical protein